MSNSLPTISSLEQLIPALKIWQQAINPSLNTPTPPRTPFNFRAIGNVAGATGVTLNWEIVNGADGYQIQSSSNGDFSTSPIIATITDGAATAWFDNTAATGTKKWYRIRATSGTKSLPQTIFSSWTAPISNVSGSGTTVYDQVSHVSGAGGWNRGNNPGVGPRLILKD